MGVSLTGQQVTIRFYVADYGMLLSTIGFVLSMWEGQKISRKASQIIEKSMENQPKPKETNGFQTESSKQVQK